MNTRLEVTAQMLETIVRTSDMCPLAHKLILWIGANHGVATAVLLATEFREVV